MSRIEPRIVTKADFPCSRLTMVCDFDSAEKIGVFYVPSMSRENRVYICEVDFLTAECTCPCESWEFRDARKSPYRWTEHGTYAEAMARIKHKRLLPLITRSPRALCGHLRRCRAFVQRHGLMDHFRAVEAQLTERLDNLTVAHG